ncbi:MAG: cellulose-binding domain-containing protein [Clostridium sp.]
MVVEVNPDGSKPYVPGSSYTTGDIVSYNGKLYKANWWTNTLPGSDSSWTLL